MGNMLYTIPTEPVLLRNKYTKGYLAIANNQLSEGRDLTLGRDVVNVPLNSGATTETRKIPRNDYSVQNAEWRIVHHADETYEILHNANNEPLYAAWGPFRNDKERRRVFTWREGPPITEGFWNFEVCWNGYYLIRNTSYNEYLYTTVHPNFGFISTCSFHDNDDKFYWEVIASK